MTQIRADSQSWRSHRLLPLATLTILAALSVFTTAAPETAWTSAVRTALASAAIGIMPGLLVCALTAPLPAATALEWFGIAFGTSFVIVQLMTVLAILGHISGRTSVTALGAVCAAISIFLLVRPIHNRLRVAAARGQWLIAALLAVLAAALYIQSPSTYWVTGEDALHLTVIRRMIDVDRPALDNLYWARGFIYTYPFPATHFFMALVSRAADLDPLFLYQKIRCLWCPAAICLVYALARVVFESERIAFASTLTAAVLTLNGTFGPISLTWGQLAPSSHASDVAMTVLLPALMLFALHFVQARAPRAAVFFFVATLSLALTLAVVHVRELVQFLVYAGAACAAYAIIRRNWRLAFRFGVLVASTTALAIVYLQWHKHAVGHIDFIVEQRREMLVNVARTLPPLDYIKEPFANPYFTTAQEFFFYQWFPVVLFLAPIVVLAYASRPLVTFVGASMLAYLLIIRLPFLAIPYVYATYYEILFTPVRNFLTFIYMLAGALLLVVADLINTIRARALQIAAALGAIAALWLGYRYAGPFFAEYQEMFLLPMIAALIVAITIGPALRWARPLVAAAESHERAPLHWSFYMLVAGMAIVGMRWQTSPLNYDRTKARWTMRQYLESMPDLPGQTFPEYVDPVSGEKRGLADITVRQSPPTPAFLAWARRTLPTDAVIVSNLFTGYALPVFLPQQIPLWPIIDGGSTLDFNARLVPAAYAAFDTAIKQHQAQPFFNDRETPDERRAYLHAVGATHLLLDPKYYAFLRPLLAQQPDHYHMVYDDGQRWAMFEVRP